MTNVLAAMSFGRLSMLTLLNKVVVASFWRSTHDECAGCYAL